MKKIIFLFALILSFSTTNLFSQIEKSNLKKTSSWFYSKARVSEDSKSIEIIYQVYHRSFVVLKVRKNLYISEKINNDDISKSMNIATNQEVLKINTPEDCFNISMVDIFSNSINLEKQILNTNPLILNISNITKGLYLIKYVKNDGSNSQISLLKY